MKYIVECHGGVMEFDDSLPNDPGRFIACDTADPMPGLNMAKDPLIAAANKVYRQSAQYELDQLLKLQSYWSRKRTIASNKLDDVRFKIDQLCKELTKDGRKLPEKKETHEKRSDKDSESNRS